MAAPAHRLCLSGSRFGGFGGRRAPDCRVRRLDRAEHRTAGRFTARAEPRASCRAAGKATSSRNGRAAPTASSAASETGCNCTTCGSLRAAPPSTYRRADANSAVVIRRAGILTSTAAKWAETDNLFLLSLSADPPIKKRNFRVER